jgi:ABC-type sulfate/molybdate transport systems ATPase subunit
MATLALDLSSSLRDFRLELALEVGRETVALVGPSGAGKSTLLRCVAGLMRPERGRVALGNEVWLDTARGVDLAPERRSVGLVFQDYALFPHLTVRQNVAFGSAGSVDDLLQRFGIAHLASARPGWLSGGERQRIAVARALARQPGVLLLDEPLAALDTHTKAGMRAELAELLGGLSLPALLVTHDFEDAASLADRVGVIVAGRLLQIGSASELVAAPADAFVASFTGANLLEGIARPGRDGLTEVVLDTGGSAFSADPGAGRVAIAVYPWEVALSREEPLDSAMNHVRADVRSVVLLGNRARVRVGALTAEVTAISVERLGLTEGERVVASFKATATRLVALGPS